MGQKGRRNAATCWELKILIFNPPQGGAIRPCPVRIAFPIAAPPGPPRLKQHLQSLILFEAGPRGNGHHVHDRR
jgi:hypothetical protein